MGDNFVSINDLIDDTKQKNYIFYGYDGTVFTSKKITLASHYNLSLRVNQIPKILREYPDNFNAFKKILFVCYLFYLNPIKYISNPKKYLKIFKNFFKM